MSTILITGVNRGIGLELFTHYAQAGWQVIGTCRDPKSANAAAAIAVEHEQASVYQLDITDDAAVNALAATLEGTPIDVLLLNAGTQSSKSSTLGKLDADDFRRILDVNVVAQAMCLQAFRGHVAASTRRIMVGMGSFLGSMALNSDGGMYSYRASKAGLHAIMRSASCDLHQDGVTAIIMHPGWVKTDMGGENAHISTAESVAGIARVIEQLTPEDSGRLLTYQGKEMPW